MWYFMDVLNRCTIFIKGIFKFKRIKVQKTLNIKLRSLSAKDAKAVDQIKAIITLQEHADASPLEVERKAIAQCAMMHIDNAQNVSKFVVHDLCYAGRLSMILEDNSDINAVLIDNNSRLKVHHKLKWLDSKISIDAKKCRKCIEQNMGFLEFAFDVLISTSAKSAQIKISRRQKQTGHESYKQGKSMLSGGISSAIKQGSDVFVCAQHSIFTIDEIISAIGQSYVLMLPSECLNLPSNRQFNTYSYSHSFIEDGPIESIRRYHMLPDVIISDCFDRNMKRWSSIGVSVILIGSEMPHEMGAAKDTVVIDILANKLFEKTPYEKTPMKTSLNASFDTNSK